MKLQLQTNAETSLPRVNNEHMTTPMQKQYIIWET